MHDHATRIRVRTFLGLLVSVALVAPVAGCSSDDPYANSGATWRQVQEQHVMDVRAAAIRHHDRAKFMSTVAKGDPALVAREGRYFDNLIQFPLSKLSFAVSTRSWPRSLVARKWRDAGRPRIRQVVQLAGYDARPEVSTTGLVLAKQGDSYKVVADRTADGEFFPRYDPQPWDLDPVRVSTSGDHVLGVFDAGTAAQADRLLALVRSGIEDDQSALPFWWDGDVVVYSFSDDDMLASFRSVPGGNIRDLGALTFPVYANLKRTSVAGMRILVLPGALTADTAYLARLVRHELTHVALGTRDDGAPTWFIEGIAEYLGARPLTRAQRRIPAVAVQRAAGSVTSMPASDTFNGPDQDWHYALAWMACDYIAAHDGESRLWDLMDALHAARGGTRDSRQDAVLERVIGMDSHQLAAKAAARIRSIYG